MSFSGNVGVYSNPLLIFVLGVENQLFDVLLLGFSRNRVWKNETTLRS